MPTLYVVSGVLLVASALGVAAWTTLLLRVGRSRAATQTVREGLDLPAPSDGWPRLSIIVPVHNEQHEIEECARLLRAQDYDDLEIVFALDRCTDDTMDLLKRHAAEDPRIVLVEIDHCPDDWAGKCHAAQQGVERASGEWLLFTDADTRFEPPLARASVALAHSRGLALLSLLSTLTFTHFFEYVAQFTAALKLAFMYPLERVNRADNPRPFANGQFMLFRRDWYEKMGGHAAVKDCLLEDIAAARLMARCGGRGGVVRADGLLHCSMYGTMAQFMTGWKRIFIEACNRRGSRMRKWGRRILLHGVVLPLAQVATLVTAPIVAATGAWWLAALMVTTVLVGWGLQMAALLRLSGLARAPRRATLLYPIGCLVVGRILFSGARDLEDGRPVVWGGRQYVLKPR